MIEYILILMLSSLQHEPYSPELHAISKLESDNGQNVAHKRGVDDFDTAYGPLGLKPKTAFDTYRKSRRLRTAHPHLDDPQSFMIRFRLDANFYAACANEHWQYLRRSTNTVSRAVYAWRWGKTAESNASNMAILFDQYVIKYHNFRRTDA